MIKSGGKKRKIPRKCHMLFQVCYAHKLLQKGREVRPSNPSKGESSAAEHRWKLYREPCFAPRFWLREICAVFAALYFFDCVCCSMTFQTGEATQQQGSMMYGSLMYDVYCACRLLQKEMGTGQQCCTLCSIAPWWLSSWLTTSNGASLWLRCTFLA